jgi:hypothetical protein
MEAFSQSSGFGRIGFFADAHPIGLDHVEQLQADGLAKRRQRVAEADPFRIATGASKLGQVDVFDLIEEQESSPRSTAQRQPAW